MHMVPIQGWTSKVGDTPLLKKAVRERTVQKGNILYW